MSPNRFAWTNLGPVCLLGARVLTTAKCRKLLEAEGIRFDRWAKNWMSFAGWQVTNITLPGLKKS